jgi:hypothetical protein
MLKNNRKKLANAQGVRSLPVCICGLLSRQAGWRQLQSYVRVMHAADQVAYKAWWYWS